MAEQRECVVCHRTIVGGAWIFEEPDRKGPAHPECYELAVNGAPARTDCSVCKTPLTAPRIPTPTVVVRGVRYHGWCYITVCAPTATKG
jgi:hypothetical protein